MGALNASPSRETTVPTTYTQLTGNAFTPSEIADAAATIGTHTGSTFEIVGGGSHAGHTIRFNAAGGQTFEYNASNEPIFGVNGQDLIGSVDLWLNSTQVATFTTISGGGNERFLDEWWATYKAAGAKTGAADAFHGLFGSTNQTGDSNDNAIETFGASSTLNGGAGGADRYVVDWNATTIVDGAGDGTVEVTDLTGSINWNMGGGTNTLVSRIVEFDAHVADGDALTGFTVFSLGAGATRFDLDSTFVPINAVFNGSAADNELFLRVAASNTYIAQAWGFSGYNGKTTLDASIASGAVTLIAPNGATILVGNGQGGANFTGGSKDDTAKFNGGINNVFDGKGGTDTILLSGAPNSSIVTRTGSNSFHIVEPGSQVTDVVNVENWASPNGGGSLAAVADDEPSPPPPTNHPPKVLTDGKADWIVDDPNILRLFEDPDADPLTITITPLDANISLAWLSPVFQSERLQWGIEGEPPFELHGKVVHMKVTADDGHGHQVSLLTWSSRLTVYRIFIASCSSRWKGKTQKSI
jgi:hypothetical protein